MSWDPDELDKDTSTEEYHDEVPWILFVFVISIVFAIAIGFDMCETKNSNQNKINVSCINGYVFYRTYKSDPWIQMIDSVGHAKVCTSL